MTGLAPPPAVAEVASSTTTTTATASSGSSTTTIRGRAIRGRAASHETRPGGTTSASSSGARIGTSAAPGDVRYGLPAKDGWGAALPTTYCSAALGEDVRAYLWAAFSEAGEAQLEDIGFERCVDYPSIPDHSYYEGYFHGLKATGAAVGSMNPRWGTLMDKPAAPRRLRAFLAAFREANAGWLHGVAGASPTLQQLHDEGSFFADLAVQVHFGEEVPTNKIGWHADGPNSILHLALGLHGHRSLHSLTLSAAEAEAGRTLSPAKNGLDTVHPQPPGAAYVSSPYCFLHGVHYPSCSWEGRVVAVQCRLLFATANAPGEAAAKGASTSVRKSECATAATLAQESQMDGHAIMSKVTEALSKARVVFPSLDAVKAAEAALP